MFISEAFHHICSQPSVNVNHAVLLVECLFVVFEIRGLFNSHCEGLGLFVDCVTQLHALIHRISSLVSAIGIRT